MEVYFIHGSRGWKCSICSTSGVLLMVITWQRTSHSKTKQTTSSGLSPSYKATNFIIGPSLLISSNSKYFPMAHLQTPSTYIFEN
jgi:hypothetical protein